MDLPPALLRAQMSAVMLTPEEMTSIYGSQNPTTSQRRVSSSAGSTNTLARRHESSASAEEIGAQRPLSQKLSIKKLGGLFRTDKRARSSVAGSSEATIAESSIESEGGRDLNSFESSVGEESRPSLHVGGELQGRMRKQRRQPPQPLRIESLHENAGHVDNEARTDGRHHQRNESLHVNLAPEDLVRVAAEIYNETIADVSLSLFIYWIRESVENYEIAKRYVRELGLDAGYNTSRIANQHVRKLLQETAPSRPKYVRARNSTALRRVPAVPNLRDPGTSWIDASWRTTTITTNFPNNTDLSLASNIRAPPPPTNIAGVAEGEEERTLTNHACDDSEPLVALQEQHDSVERVASRSAVALPSSSFPVTARIDSLPARLRIQRERAVQEATRASSTGDRIAEYPPNSEFLFFYNTPPYV
ncbi:hypothetical protein BDW02DRAFT_578916 [Decorospora gaudefroyi]|uniref:Uncharacterized protein n=1 Tax=Decorospora gaudefroyi TaxID=184978 RepID=A0A6A5KP03_9PLEO|nr:hypothetical protein BDW02DRAFT_578916 [Decorospora gaudefroyi]